MGLQGIGSQHEGATMAQLEVRHLKFGADTRNDHPVFAPVKLESFAWVEAQLDKRFFAGGALGFLLTLLLLLLQQVGVIRGSIFDANKGG